MNLQITPINFTGGQRIKIKITNNMEDYKKGFEIGTAEEFSNFIKKKCLFKYRISQ